MAGKPRTIGARISISLMDGPSNHANHYSIDLQRSSIYFSNKTALVLGSTMLRNTRGKPQ